jgi:hypothetical protein
MERRSGKDRRKHIDPRYQSAAYPEFIDRRIGRDRRRGSYQDLPGHPTRKRIILIGAVVALFLVYLFLLASFLLTKSPHRSVRKKTITFAYHQDHEGNHAWALGGAMNQIPRPRFS